MKAICIAWWKGDCNAEPNTCHHAGYHRSSKDCNDKCIINQKCFFCVTHPLRIAVIQALDKRKEVSDVRSS